MKIIIKTSGVYLADDVSEFIEKKVGNLSRFVKRFEKKSEINLFLEIGLTTHHHKHGEIFYAEITLHLPNKTLRAEQSDSELKTAIHGVKEKIQDEIRKYKEKVIDFPKRSSRESDSSFE